MNPYDCQPGCTCSDCATREAGANPEPSAEQVRLECREELLRAICRDLHNLSERVCYSNIRLDIKAREVQDFYESYVDKWSAAEAELQRVRS